MCYFAFVKRVQAWQQPPPTRDCRFFFALSRVFVYNFSWTWICFLVAFISVVLRFRLNRIYSIYIFKCEPCLLKFSMFQSTCLVLIEWQTKCSRPHFSIVCWLVVLSTEFPFDNALGSFTCAQPIVMCTYLLNWDAFFQRIQLKWKIQRLRTHAPNCNLGEKMAEKSTAKR